MRPDACVALAETSRSGFPESTHFGVVVALRADGSVAFAAGDPSVAVYPRSSTKPMQALAMVRHGLHLPADLLALVCASHDGTPVHLTGVQRILQGAGLDESALENTPDLPIEDAARRAVLRAGGSPSSLLQNCSGKHAGMLATCVINGWPTAGYLHAEHPLQRAIDHVLPEFTGEPLGHIGIDGCGAPAHVMSLLALARAYRTVAMAPTVDPASAAAQVAAAMSGHPEMVGGARREATLLMRALPGAVAKDGAEAVFAIALADGRTVALKVADGGARAAAPVTIEALRRLDVDVDAVAPSVQQAILGHGAAVGSVTALAGAFDQTR